MIGRMMLREFSQNKKTAVLKVAVPFVIVAGAGIAGYAGLGLAMLLIFTGVIGAGMSVVRLKTGGLYDRLIASPVRKTDLFLEIAGAQTLILVVQYLPALAAAAYFTGPAVIYPAILSLLVVVVIGIAIGTASKGLGDMHLNATLAVLPLLLATFVPFSATRILPFHGIIAPELTVPGIVLPFVTLIVFYLLFLSWVSRL
jgi:hypothetical protein